MKFFSRIFIPFIGLCFVSCSLMPSEMKTAEKLMETSPDSALTLLKQVQPDKLLTNSDRALYGLLLFQALDKTKQVLQPDSAINFSINYYEKTNNKERLASCYFYKGRRYNNLINYDVATVYYLKALDNGKYSKNYFLLGKLYSDIGNIFFLQKDYKESRKKYLLAFENFKLANKNINASYILLDIGRTYWSTNDFKTARAYFNKALSQTKDTKLLGAVFQDIGSNNYLTKNYDSALFYLRKCVKFPNIGTDYSTRYYMIANIKFEIEEYDSALHYALIALKYPITFYTKRESYRILANTCYLKKDLKQMGKYMTCYQICTDSILRMESQTKATVIEKIFKNKQENKQAIIKWFWIVAILLIILILALYAGHLIYKRYKFKIQQLEKYKLQLARKQAYVSKNLEIKIQEIKAIQQQTNTLANIAERNKICNELYTNCLHLNNWELFSNEMNQTFNQIITKIQLDCPEITQKEIIYSCLYLLDIPTADRIPILGTTTDGLYKLKQRLAKKLNLESTKELDTYLKKYINPQLN